MPNWGWLIIMLILVDVAVVTVWLLTRRKGEVTDRRNPAIVRGLDLETRDRLERLVADHQQTQAIGLLRDRTGLGLADAKAAIDAVSRGEWVPTAGPDSVPPTTKGWSDLVPALRELKTAGKVDEAIRMLRDHTGMSSNRAKESVEQL